ncbi:MAG: NAD(P)H-dependent glycerol-3-phosphate dehydrogenase [Flavobacteriales bacterium]|nr:NAD(P)H-dependent glycerol-3-phosphate dehydrogenase [Flavobacteriales bacterium]
MKIGVIGGGSWPTALVKILGNNVTHIHWWMRNEKAAEHFTKFYHNPNYLSSIQFEPNKVSVSTNLQHVINESEVLIMGVPAAFLVDVFNTHKTSGIKNKILFSAIKGMVPEYHAIPARFFHKQFGTPYDKIGIICGPCHAEEVAMEKLSYLTIACQNTRHAEMMANFLSCRYIKTTVSDDLFGTELSAVLKNVFAIAAGICHGLGYGDNFQAILVTNAIQEIERFVDAVNPIHRDVKSSAYLGDLLVTAYSQFSRNRNFGTMIGKGYSVKAAQLEMNMTAEGYYAVKSLHEMNKKFNVQMPITEAVYRILYEKMSPIMEMSLLTDKLS